MLKKNEHRQAYDQTKLAKEIWLQQQPVVIYSSHRKRMLYFVAIIALLTSILVSYSALTLLGNDPAAEYTSTLSFRLWQIFFLVAGNSMSCAVLWLHNRYILQLTVLPGKTIEIVTWGIFSKRQKQINFGDFQSIIDSNGTTIIPGSPIVIAPYSMLETEHKRYLLDQSGDFPHGSRLVYELFNQR